MGRNECLFAINDLVELFSGNKDKFHSEGKLEELYTHDSRGALLMRGRQESQGHTKACISNISFTVTSPGELIKLLKDGWHLWQLEQDRLVSVKHLHQHKMTVPFYLEVKTSSGSV